MQTDLVNSIVVRRGFSSSVAYRACQIFKGGYAIRVGGKKNLNVRLSLHFWSLSASFQCIKQIGNV